MIVPHCELCFVSDNITDEDLCKCDTCDRFYCEDCTYTFSLQYQFQGCRCYECSDHNRIKGKINFVKLRDNKLKVLMKY